MHRLPAHSGDATCIRRRDREAARSFTSAVTEGVQSIDRRPNYKPATPSRPSLTCIEDASISDLVSGR
jgi:hypothetical protein